MLQVGQRIEWHCVFFEEIVDLKLGRKPQQPSDILRGQDTRPEAIQDETLQHMTGDIFPLRLDALSNIIRQMNSNFHTALSRRAHAPQRTPGARQTPAAPV